MLSSWTIKGIKENHPMKSYASVETFDPGGWSDNFAALYSVVTRDKILLTDAIYWNKKEKPSLTNLDIKNQINTISKEYKFDYHLCETNNQGNMIISDLRNIPYRIPVLGITTSGNLKNPTTRAFKKDRVVPWVQKFIEEGMIEWPRKMTPGLKAMKTEIENYGVTKKGKYEALEGTDDFISCLVILVHWAMKKMINAMARKIVGAGPRSDSPSRITTGEQFAQKFMKQHGHKTNNMRINIRQPRDYD